MLLENKKKTRNKESWMDDCVGVCIHKKMRLRLKGERGMMLFLTTTNDDG